MRVKPIRRYRTPRYPTRLDVLADPDLLARHQPATWSSSSEMAKIVALMLTVNGTLHGCSSHGVTTPSSPARTVKVAPIFVHGDGVAGMGCVVVNPPVFLSEQDAMQVITEEMRKAGVNLTVRKRLTGVSMPEHRGSGLGPDREPTGKLVPLSIDAFDDRLKIAVEFVSSEDYVEKGGVPFNGLAGAEDYRTVAGDVAAAVTACGTSAYLGVFYDPATNPPDASRSARERIVDSYYEKQQRTDDWNEQVALRKKLESNLAEYEKPWVEESRRLLREQVDDFISWLKAQGAI